MKNRIVDQIIKKIPTFEGAGVRLHRVFGFDKENMFDPFLLLDDFSSNHPADYIQGFPWHPHRGIETITYILEGKIVHQDSLGNRGTINPGGVQWMTAGSGIIHQEMPQQTEGRLVGFQLWANLPQSHKLMDPRYREIRAHEIPTVEIDEKIIVKIVAGEINGISGPVSEIVTKPEFYDVSLMAETEWKFHTHPDRTVFIYIIDGQMNVDPQTKERIPKGHLVSYIDGDMIHFKTSTHSCRFLLIAGDPIIEPVAWQGPIVMNTEAELQQAFRDYQNGTFIKVKNLSLEND